MESDIFDFWSFLTIFLRPDQILIKCKQCFVDFKYIIVPLFHKIFHDNIEFARMWQSESGLAKHILHFCERQFKSQCKRKHRLLGWPIELVRTKLGKQFPVNVRFFIALCISHTLFINFYSFFYGSILRIYFRNFLHSMFRMVKGIKKAHTENIKSCMRFLIRQSIATYVKFSML